MRMELIELGDMLRWTLMLLIDDAISSSEACVLITEIHEKERQVRAALKREAICSF